MKKTTIIFLFGLILIKSCSAISCLSCMRSGQCKPPSCFCCRDTMGLSMPTREIPQIVFFTFDDALTDMAASFYNRLFESSRINPNGCPISMTMFVSHSDTQYKHVHDFHRKGMEIGAHSVTHSHMNPNNFYNEAKSQKRNLAKYGNFSESEVVGWRSPFLEPVGDLQPEKLKQLGYTYDATLTFSKRKLNGSVPSPFTLDFGWPYDCKVKPCPRGRHSGFWEVPVVSLLDYRHQYDCVYVDGCMNVPPNEEAAFKFLLDNFHSYYQSERVPFGINMHPSWFYTPERLNAMDRFIKELVKMDDVFILSVKKTLEWLKNPTPLSSINSFSPWQCGNSQQGVVKRLRNDKNTHFQTRKRQNHNRKTGPLLSHHLFRNPQIPKVKNIYSIQEIPKPPSIEKNPTTTPIDTEQILQQKRKNARLATIREIKRHIELLERQKAKVERQRELSRKESRKMSSTSSLSSDFNKVPMPDTASRQLSNMQNNPERKLQQSEKSRVMTTTTLEESPRKEFEIPFRRHSRTWGRSNTKTSRQRKPIFQKPRFEFQHKLPKVVSKLFSDNNKARKSSSRTSFAWKYRIPNKEPKPRDNNQNTRELQKHSKHVIQEQNTEGQSKIIHKPVSDKSDGQKANVDSQWDQFVRMIMGHT